MVGFVTTNFVADAGAALARALVFSRVTAIGFDPVRSSIAKTQLTPPTDPGVETMAPSLKVIIR